MQGLAAPTVAAEAGQQEGPRAPERLPPDPLPHEEYCQESPQPVGGPLLRHATQTREHDSRRRSQPPDQHHQLETVDIRAVHMDLQNVWPINIDPSISVPFCPTWVGAASRDFGAFMESRLQSKVDKHAVESASSQHSFISVPATTLGNVHGKLFWDLTDPVWSREFHRARRQGIRDHVVTREKQDDTAARHAIIVRYCAEATIRLAHPPGFAHTRVQPAPTARPAPAAGGGRAARRPPANSDEDSDASGTDE